MKPQNSLLPNGVDAVCSGVITISQKPRYLSLVIGKPLTARHIVIRDELGHPDIDIVIIPADIDVQHQPRR